VFQGRPIGTGGAIKSLRSKGNAQVQLGPNGKRAGEEGDSDQKNPNAIVKRRGVERDKTSFGEGGFGG